jgi:AraC family transcriptional regulator, melibiose operon regulatory protein
LSAKQSTAPVSFGLRCIEGSPPTMGSFHRHNDIEINLLTRGAITYHFGSSSVRLAADTFALFWAAMPHQLVDVEPDSHMFWVTLPLAQFMRWTLPADMTKQALDGRFLVTAAAPSDVSALQRWKADHLAKNTALDEIFLLELEARLRRMGVALDETTPSARSVGRTSSSVGANKAERMSRYIAEHFTEQMRVEQVAKSVHIHPTYAMHLFRETFGISIVDYLTQHRIAHAQQLLATTEMSVMEIALASGFNSVSRFYAAFNGICGKSPRAYREQLRGS